MFKNKLGLEQSSKGTILKKPWTKANLTNPGQEGEIVGSSKR